MNNTLEILDYIKSLNDANRKKVHYTDRGKAYKKGYEDALNSVQQKIDNMIDDFFAGLEKSTYNK